MSTDAIGGNTNPNAIGGPEQTGEGTETKPTNPPASSMSDPVGDFSKLKATHPEIWKKTLEAMATTINNDSRKHEEKLKQIRQEYERS